MKLLVVEDDTLLRNIMEDALADTCTSFQGFDSSDDALVHMLTSKDLPDVAIIDQNLHSQLKGTELADMIRQRWPNTGIILSSGSPLQTPEDYLLTRFILKPWSLDDLQNTIQELEQLRFEQR